VSTVVAGTAEANQVVPEAGLGGTSGGRRLACLSPTDPRPNIYIRGGELPQMTDEAMDALLKAKVIYQRGGHLVHTCRLPQAEINDEIRRARGSIVLRKVCPNFLVDQMGRHAIWWKTGRRLEKGKRVRCQT
jgi:hypothetical protein